MFNNLSKGLVYYTDNYNVSNMWAFKIVSEVSNFYNSGIIRADNVDEALQILKSEYHFVKGASYRIIEVPLIVNGNW